MPSTAALFELAMRHQAAGNQSGADALYQHIIQADPGHAEAHHMLGILKYQSGHIETGLALIRRSIDLDPRAANFQSNLALLLKEQGRFAEAEEYCRRALTLAPDFADALNNLGIVLKAQGRADEAAESYRRALRVNPSHAQACNNLGLVFADQGKLAEAIECYQNALRLNPQFADAHSNLGIVFKEKNRTDEAVDCYRKALAINPHHANACNNLGAALKEKGQLAEAIGYFQRALRLNPRSVETLVNLGAALRIQGLLPQALECFHEALRLDPAHTNAHNNLGVVMLAQGNPAQAVASFQEALRHDPQFADALSNLGLALKQMGKLDEAALYFDEALSHEPDHAPAHANRSMLRLLQGDFENGWPEYEFRWGLHDQCDRHLERPRWDGSRLGDKTILLYAEQGLGDTVQFIRYAPLVKERVGTVVFECPPPLVDLLARTAGVDCVVARGAPLPPFDVRAPLLSLPHIFATTVATIPASIPYLRADAARRAAWAEELKDLSGVKVGIVWQGSRTYRDDIFRSVALAHFEKLAGLQRVRLVSLQVGPGSEQIATVTFPVYDLGRRFNPDSLEDLAAGLMSVDMVVTVDTAPAHIAGALGIPVWLLLPFTPDWRWLLDREDSPWYPAVRLFRQTSPGDWAEVFERVTGALGPACRLH